MTKKAAQLAHDWIKNADAILVTASNGFSISEGLNLFAHDDKLHEVLGNLVEKYNLSNLLMAFQYPYPNELDHWRVVARIAEYYDYNYDGSKYTETLKKIIGDKPYYIWTSNTEHHFQMAGLDHVLEIEGSWYDGICSAHPDKHPHVNLRKKLHEIYEKDMAGILTEADLPKCEVCGAPVVQNIASTPDFMPNKEQIQSFRQFLVNNQNRDLVVLELGIGPQNKMIKEPTMELVATTPKTHYISVNKGELNILPDIKERSIGFSSTIDEAFKEILTGKSYGAHTEGPAKKTELSPEEKRRQEETMQKFYPNYMVDQSFQPGSFPVYLTIDKDNPSYLHANQYGQYWMYSMGDAATVHCFTQQGKYYKVDLGLDKSKNQEHGFYIEPGTLFAVELADKNSNGFSQLSTSIPTTSNGEVLLPKKNALIDLFPDQKEIIEKLTK